MIHNDQVRLMTRKRIQEEMSPGETGFEPRLLSLHFWKTFICKASATHRQQITKFGQNRYDYLCLQAIGETLPLHTLVQATPIVSKRFRSISFAS